MDRPLRSSVYPVATAPRGRCRPAALSRLFGALAAMLLAIAPGAGAEAAPSCWSPPVDAPVSDPYRSPGCLWCVGNRGIEFGTSPGQPVRAVAAGTVSFAGSVAGTEYLVVQHPDGRRATYGNISEVTLEVGDPVVAGMRLGIAAGPFHFGLRDGDRYVDPTPLLGRWVGRARLIPTDGSPPRSAAPELLCGTLPPLAFRR